MSDALILKGDKQMAVTAVVWGSVEVYPAS